MDEDWWQSVGGDDEWYILPFHLGILLLQLHHQALPFQSQLAGMVFVSRVEELHKAALLTDDKVWTHPTTLVAAVEVALGLVIVFHLEDLIYHIGDLSLASIWYTVDQGSIVLGLHSEDEILDNILNEWTMLSCLNAINDLLECSFLWPDTFDIFSKVCSGIWILLLRLEEVINMFCHPLKLISLQD